LKKVRVEVIGVSPPCARCKKVEENARKAAAKLSSEGYSVAVEKLSITAKEMIARYGVLVAPAIAVNGTVKIMGKVPDVRMIERLLRQAV
jgi:hypothetical protein